MLDDEPDNRILERAVVGRTDIIVTADKAILNLEACESIRIASFRQFLDEIASLDE